MMRATVSNSAGGALDRSMITALQRFTRVAANVAAPASPLLVLRGRTVMKRHPLFFALIVALGLTAADPLFAQSTSKQDEIKALKATVAKQQQQLNQQQQDLQSLRDSITKLEGEQGQQQAQIQAQAAAPPPPPPAAPTFTTTPGL